MSNCQHFMPSLSASRYNERRHKKILRFSCALSNLFTAFYNHIIGLDIAAVGWFQRRLIGFMHKVFFA